MSGVCGKCVTVICWINESCSNCPYVASTACVAGERIDWLEPASRLTQRLRVWLEGLLRILPISHVSQLTGLHWRTLKALDKRHLETGVGAFEPGAVW